LAGTVSLGLSDEESEGASGSKAGGGSGEDLAEALDGSESDDRRRGLREVLGAAGEYIDISQCKCADDLPEEGDLLVLRFDEGDRGARRPDLDGQAREAGAGADVEEAAGSALEHRRGTGRRTAVGRRKLGSSGWWARGLGRIAIRTIRAPGEEVLGGEEGLAKVAGDDVFRIADGGEVDAGIPTEQ